MISASLTRRLALLAALSSALWLAACNGSDGDGNGNATVRALNLTSDIPSIDVYTSETKRFSAVATDVVSDNVTLEANTQTLVVKKAGDGTLLKSGTYSLSKDKHYTAVVWGRESSLNVHTLPEDEDTAAIDAGNARVRFFSATTDAGSLDIYLTEPGADLGDSLATQGALTAGSLSGFRDLTAKTYRLRVTGAGDPSDVRLDIASVTLTAKTYSTLVLTAGASGVLLNGTLIAQQGAVTTMRNTKARVRVVASVASNANVGATLGGTTLAGGMRSPSIGPYALVDAGSALDLRVTVAGNVVSTGARTLSAGSDYTVLAYGPSPASGTPASVSVLTDDNRVPTVVGRTKIRLINGAFGTDPATLQISLAAVATGIEAGQASTYSTLVSNAEADIAVFTSNIDLLFEDDDVNLQAQGVYTVFLLGGNANPTGVIRKER